MFKISSKGIYGSQAMIELAIRYGSGVCQIKEIADHCQIPKTYLEQLFNILKKSGLILSVRGNKGGYELGRDPKTITLLEVLEILEGEVSVCSKGESGGALLQLFHKTEQCIKDGLDIPLAELAELEKKSLENVTFYI